MALSPRAVLSCFAFATCALLVSQCNSYRCSHIHVLFHVELGDRETSRLNPMQYYLNTITNSQLLATRYTWTCLCVAKLDRMPNASLAAILRCRVAARSGLSPLPTSFRARAVIGPSAVHCHTFRWLSEYGHICFMNGVNFAHISVSSFPSSSFCF